MEKDLVRKILPCCMSFLRNLKASLATVSPPASLRSKPPLGRDAFLPLREPLPVFAFFFWDFEPAVGGISTGARGGSGSETEAWLWDSLKEGFDSLISLQEVQKN